MPDEKSPEEIAVQFLVDFLKSDNVDGEGMKLRAAESILNYKIMLANTARYDFPNGATKQEG